MEYEIRTYHFGKVDKIFSGLTKQQARIEYFWQAENVNQYTELWVDGKSKKTWEAKKILGFDGKREFHFGKAQMARKAKEAARSREREEALEQAIREKRRPFIAPRPKNKPEVAATKIKPKPKENQKNTATYYERNREEILEKQKAWRKNNPERVREIKRKYRESHRKEENQRARERYAERKAKEGGE